MSSGLRFILTVLLLLLRLVHVSTVLLNAIVYFSIITYSHLTMLKEWERPMFLFKSCSASSLNAFFAVLVSTWTYNGSSCLPLNTGSYTRVAQSNRSDSFQPELVDISKARAIKKRIFWYVPESFAFTTSPFHNRTCHDVITEIFLHAFIHFNIDIPKLSFRFLTGLVRSNCVPLLSQLSSLL